MGSEAKVTNIDVCDYIIIHCENTNRLLDKIKKIQKNILDNKDVCTGCKKCQKCEGCEICKEFSCRGCLNCYDCQECQKCHNNECGCFELMFITEPQKKLHHKISKKTIHKISKDANEMDYVLSQLNTIIVNRKIFFNPMCGCVRFRCNLFNVGISIMKNILCDMRIYKNYELINVDHIITNNNDVILFLYYNID